MQKKTTRGFTLIELMVVIGIISLLSSIVLASVKTARDRTNETRILRSVQGLQTAVELFKTEKGYYPGTIGHTASSFSSYKYPSGAIITKAGDFSNFSKYMNLDLAFDPTKLPDNFAITYVANQPGPFEDWYSGANMIITCGVGTGSGVDMYPKMVSGDRYVIAISYKKSVGVISKLMRTFVFFEGYDDYEYGDAEGVFYFNDTAVCVSNP